MYSRNWNVALSAKRILAGLKDAQCRGVKFGRRPDIDAVGDRVRPELIDAGERREDIAALLNVNLTTLDRGVCRNTS
jgi:hypothetical protein